MTVIQIEVTFCAWQANIFGNKQSSTTLREHIDKGATFEDLLNHLVRSYPSLKDTLIDTASQQLYDNIIVIVNGRLLDLIGGMQAHMKDGDKVQFLPCLPGG